MSFGSTITVPKFDSPTFLNLRGGRYSPPRPGSLTSQVVARPCGTVLRQAGREQLEDPLRYLPASFWLNNGRRRCDSNRGRNRCCDDARLRIATVGAHVVGSCLGQALQAIVTQAQKNVLFGFEVSEEGPRGYFGLMRDVGHGHPVEPFFPVEAHRRVDQSLSGSALFDLSEPWTAVGSRRPFLHGFQLLSCTCASMHYCS